MGDSAEAATPDTQLVLTPVDGPAPASLYRGLGNATHAPSAPPVEVQP